MKCVCECIIRSRVIFFLTVRMKVKPAVAAVIHSDVSEMGSWMHPDVCSITPVHLDTPSDLSYFKQPILLLQQQLSVLRFECYFSLCTVEMIWSPPVLSCLLLFFIDTFLSNSLTCDCSNNEAENAKSVSATEPQRGKPPIQDQAEAFRSRRRHSNQWWEGHIFNHQKVYQRKCCKGTTICRIMLMMLCLNRRIQILLYGNTGNALFFVAQNVKITYLARLIFLLSWSLKCFLV